MAFDTDVVDDNASAETTEAETSIPQDAPEPEQSETEQPDGTEGEGEQPDDGEKPEGEKSDGNESESDSKPKKGAAARIQQLVAEKKAAEAELERLRQESPQPKQTASPDGAPVPPSMDDYDIDTEEGLDKYWAAQAEYEQQYKNWEFDTMLSQREQQRQQQQREAEITDQFKQRFESNPKFKEDFAQLATLMQDKPVQADPSQLYQGEELMDLLETVAADPDLYYEIAGLPEQAQYAKFGEIQASIKARKNNKPTAQRPKAPPPPNHTKSNAPISRSEYEKSDEDFLAARGL